MPYIIILINKTQDLKPCRVGLVVSVFTTHTVGRGFESQPGHTASLHGINRKSMISYPGPRAI